MGNLATASFAALAFLAGCKSKSDPSPLTQVLQGRPDTGDPAVVALRIGSNYCTGTVVAPKYVLTAAHCFDPGGAVAISTRHSNIYVPDGWKPAAAVHIENGWMPGQKLWNSDIALVELAESINVPPVPINFDGAAAQRLREVRTIGYGPTGTNFGDQGTKREATVPIHPLPNFLETESGKGFCFGDSGGPSFATIDGQERIVAVTSHILDTNQCELGGRVVRTDVHRPFLARFLPLAPVPSSPAAAAPAPPPGSVAPTVPPPFPNAPLNPYRPPNVPNTPPPPVVSAAPDPTKTVDCSDNQVVTLTNTSITVANGPAIRGSGHCRVTLTGVDVRGPVGIDVSGNAQVTMTGGTINAATTAVAMSGSSSVQLVGTRLTGASKATGNATLVGVN